MTPWAYLLLVVFSLSALALGYAFWRGPLWLRVVATLLGCFWLYYAQWNVRAYANARWIDDSHSRHQQDVVIAAIKAGKTHIPLAETTDFPWSTVCQVWAQPPFSPAWDKETMHKVFSTDRMPYFENGGGGEYEVLVYATPAGPYVMEPVWMCFSREFQGRFMGRYYQNQLGGKGYWIEERMNEFPEKTGGGLCLKPEDIWLKIQPEP